MPDTDRDWRWLFIRVLIPFYLASIGSSARLFSLEIKRRAYNIKMRVKYAKAPNAYGDAKIKKRIGYNWCFAINPIQVAARLRTVCKMFRCYFVEIKLPAYFGSPRGDLNASLERGFRRYNETLRGLFWLQFHLFKFNNLWKKYRMYVKNCQCFRCVANGKPGVQCNVVTHLAHYCLRYCLSLYICTEMPDTTKVAKIMNGMVVYQYARDLVFLDQGRVFAMIGFGTTFNEQKRQLYFLLFEFIKREIKRERGMIAAAN